jgi:predicted NBD/HSP70 family sugar kinase
VTESSQKTDANVLVVDVGGHNVKILATGQTEPRKLATGPKFTPDQMVIGVKDLTRDWNYDVITIGFPAPVRQDRPVVEPFNLGRGWVGFDYPGAFGRPVKMINDAAMQALGCYQGGKMLFLGLGTGLGSSMIVEGIVVPTELCRLPYKKATFEDYVGTRGLERLGKKKWRRCVEDAVAQLIAALEPEDVALGGGNVKYLKDVPPGCRIVDNSNAFIGGFRVWEGVQGVRGVTGVQGDQNLHP